jgi:DNA-binding MarR family transcriptional regulator
VSDTRWLNPEEQQTWRTFLAAIQLLEAQLDRELQAMLSESPGRAARMSDLAEITQSSRSRLSHAVAKLEELGWVERVECPEDRRGAYAVLTGKGFAVLEKAAHGHVEAVRTHLFDQLTPEQVNQLRGISEALVRHLRPEAAAGSASHR